MKKQEEDPEGFKAWKKKRAEESKLKRMEIMVGGGERLQRQREQTASRNKRLRARKSVDEMAKNPQKTQRPAVKKMTRAQKKQQKLEEQRVREKRRDLKRQQRAKLSAQKKRRVKEQDKNRKAKKRRAKAKTSKQTQQSANDSTPGTSGFPSANARHKAVSRTRKVLPREATKYADVVHGLCKATPRRAKALSKYGLGVDCRRKLALQRMTVQSVQEEGRKQKSKIINNLAKKLKAKALCRYGSKELKIDRNFLMRASRIKEEDDPTQVKKPRGKCLKREIEDSIKTFYRRPDISTELPNKKSVKKMTATRVLTITLNAAYELWKRESGFSVSFSCFARRRPDDVKVVSKMPLIQCLCEYCANIELKLAALNKKAGRQVVKDRYQLLATYLCPKGAHEKYYNRSCYEEGKCQQCGPEKIGQIYSQAIDPTQMIEWKVWKSVKEKYKDKFTFKKKLVDCPGTVEQCLEELKKEAKPYAKHMHVAKWQYLQFTDITSSLPENTTVLVMDYAENYKCEYQHEAQSAHWGKETVTLHPIVAFYNCQTCGNGNVVRHCIDMVTNDNTHDFHAVNHFLQRARELLPPNLTREIQFTDGCRSQYKSRGPFCDLSFSSQDVRSGYTVERHFFGSRHGKGPCDGEGGVVKSVADRAVRAGKAVIRNALEFQQFLSSEHDKPAELDGVCQHSRRNVIYVESQNIDRNRNERAVKAALKGSSIFQAVKGIRPGKVSTRNLSCFCVGCESNGACSMVQHVDGWVDRDLAMAFPQQICILLIVQLV